MNLIIWIRLFLSACLRSSETVRVRPAVCLFQSPCFSLTPWSLWFHYYCLWRPWTWRRRSCRVCSATACRTAPASPTSATSSPATRPSTCSGRWWGACVCWRAAPPPCAARDPCHALLGQRKTRESVKAEVMGWIRELWKGIRNRLNNDVLTLGLSKFKLFYIFFYNLM